MIDLNHHPENPKKANVTLENHIEASLLATSLLRKTWIGMLAFYAVDHKPFEELMDRAGAADYPRDVSMTERQLRIAHQGLVARIATTERPSARSSVEADIAMPMAGRIGSYLNPQRN